jgi:repressor LexA
MFQPTVSPMQLRILEYIRACAQGRGYPPSVREIGAHVDVTSTSTVHYHLGQLELKGYLSRVPNRSRAISVRFPGEVAA